MTTPSEPRHRHAADDPESAPPGASAAVDDRSGNGAASDAGPEMASSLYAHDQPTSAIRPALRRPPELWGGAVFLTLAALPVVVLGLLLALQPGSVGANLRQKIVDSKASVNPDTLLGVFRGVGAVLLVLGVVFLVLAWQAVRPKRGARTGVTVLVVIEVVLLVMAMVVSAPDPVSIGMLLLGIAGTVLLYLPRSEEFIGYRR
ncbi:MAG: hypothetical protein J2P19_12120 [Pseudonocardia sp.]|nr:hypothetical protein [Pseudonocardia sp.]